MDKFTEEIIVFAGIAISLLVVGIGVVSLFLIYRQKQMQTFKEKEMLKVNFERQLLESQLEVQENIFDTISREIHDNVGQVLSLAKVQLNVMEESADTNMSLVREVKDGVGKALTDLRDISKSLSTDRVKFADLPDSIETELKRFERAIGLQTHFALVGAPREIQENKKLIIFRIIQESLQNILKHANATRVEVDMHYYATSLGIKVKDNGVGFAQNGGHGRSGLGLSNIVKRAGLIGGNASIESEPGGGTTVQLTISYA